jgi:hypothetical protein
MSPIVVITAVESGSGFLLTSFILYLLLKHLSKAYHYFFAAFLLICAIWDLGTFFLMIRNSHVNELEVIGFIIGIPCGFIPALIFHFSNLYTGRPIRWAIVVAWGINVVFMVLGILGLYWKIEGVHTYNWGNIFRIAPSVFNPISMVAWFGLCLTSCWILFKAEKRAATRLERRHYLYITLGLLVMTFAIVKVGVVMGLNVPILLPLGMFLVDIFNAIIGIAIIKDRLFDITVIIKKGTLYSLLAGLLILTYSLVEHFLVTFIGEKVGENSAVLHIIAVAVGIAVLMPVKNRIERGVEGYFAHRKLEF